MADEHKGTFTLRELIEVYPDPEERRRVVTSGEITIEATARPRLSPKQVEAIKRAIRALNEEQQEYKGVSNYPTQRDLEIESAVAILEDMLNGA